MFHEIQLYYSVLFICDSSFPIGVNQDMVGNIVRWNAKRVSLVLNAGESAYAKIMLLVMRKTAHVIVNQDGLVSNVTIHVLLITMARTAIQSASVRMEDHVNLLMAIALVWMNGKEKFVISVSCCMVTIDGLSNY